MPTDQEHGILRSPRLLAIMPTLACTSACADCGSASSPKRHCKLEVAVIMDAITQASDLGFSNVVFTGGEATLEWNTLLQGVRYASSLGLRPRLVTNAHWAHSLDRARKRVQLMTDSGLDNINFSTGDEHARFVPLPRVMNAVVASIEAGLPVHIMVEYKADRSITKEIILNHDTLSLLSQEQRDQIQISESPWMPIDSTRSGCYARADTVDNGNVALREGCPSILQTYALEADGRLAACCGLGIEDIPELYVSRARVPGFLKKGVDAAESDFIKFWLHVKGPEHILAWAERKNPAIAWQNMYAHNCHACRRIYKDPEIASIIQENYEELITDVFQSLWFDEVYYRDQMRLSSHERTQT